MGWCSAGQYMEVVAEALIEAGASDEIKVAALVPLIDALLDGDWDTAHESLGLFEGDPAVVEAFRRCGIIEECRDKYVSPVKDDYKTGINYCDLEKGHVSAHRDSWTEKSWVNL